MAVQLITSSGSWVCPTGVTQVTVEVWAGGGAGGKGGSSNKNGGGGGGGGGYSRKENLSVTPGNSYPCTIGAGGTATAGNGNPGEDTIFASYVSASGGGGGASYTNGAAGGAGGTGITGGSTNFTGGSGSKGEGLASGAGGGGAGSSGNGDSAGAYNDPGTATADYGGAGGAGTTSNSGAGSAGSSYGGGGGGATKAGTPGAGAPGLIRLTYGWNRTFSYDTETIHISQSVSGSQGFKRTVSHTFAITDDVSCNHVVVSAFKKCAIRYYTGSSWVRGILKRWNGTSWSPVDVKIQA